MKADREYALLTKLYKYASRNSRIMWCKVEFEKFFGYGEKNKDFRTWLDSLIDYGCLVNEGSEPKGFGKPTIVYSVNKTLLYRKLMQNEVWQDTYDIHFMLRVK